MDSDKLWKLLDSVQAQIRVFDTKAQIVIAVDGVLAGFFGTQTSKMAELIGQQPSSIFSILLIVFGVGCIGFVLYSLLFAVATVHPRLHLDQPNSRLFFVHIAQEFKRDYSRAGDVLMGLTLDELSVDLAHQILVNSIICCTKAKRFKHALLAMSAAVIVWVLVLFMQFARQEEAVLGIAPVPQSRSMPNNADTRPTVQNLYFCQPEGPSRGGVNRQKLPAPRSEPR
jgi:Pycsar effector protein